MKRIFISILFSCFVTTPTITLAKKITDHGVLFEDVSHLLPFEHSGNGEGLNGLAWLDYDNDGDLDLYLTNGVFSNNALLQNGGFGNFIDVTLDAGVAGGTGNSGIVVADIDNDGNADIFLTGEGHVMGPAQTPNILYYNNGDGTFSNITEQAGLSDATSALGATMGDINNDGFLDIFVAAPGHIPIAFPPAASYPNKLYLNNGDLTFTDISASAGIEGLYVDPGTGLTVTDGACVAGFTDFDKDNKMDILVGNCNAYPLMPFPLPVRATPFNLYKNNGDNTFTDVAIEAGLGIPGYWMGLAFGDYNNDGNVDFFATSVGTFSPSGNLLHAMLFNNGDGTFNNVAADVGVAEAPFGWGASSADYDNDGKLDLFTVGSLPPFGAIGPGPAGGNPGKLYFNHGMNGFMDASAATNVDLSFDFTSGVAQGDFNNDGFSDLVVARAPWAIPGTPLQNPNGKPLLLKNNGNNNNAINVKLIGTKSNRDGIGARVMVKTKHHRKQIREKRAGSSMASSESPWLSFGIGFHKKANVKVKWPSGLVEVFKNVKAGKVKTLVEGSGKIKKHYHH